MEEEVAVYNIPLEIPCVRDQIPVDKLNELDLTPAESQGQSHIPKDVIKTGSVLMPYTIRCNLCSMIIQEGTRLTTIKVPQQTLDYIYFSCQNTECASQISFFTDKVSNLHRLEEGAER